MPQIKWLGSFGLGSKWFSAMNSSLLAQFDSFNWSEPSLDVDSNDTTGLFELLTGLVAHVDEV